MDTQNTQESQPVITPETVVTPEPTAAQTPISAPQVQIEIQLPKASDLLKQAFAYFKANIALIATIFSIPFVLNLLQMSGVFGYNGLFSLVTNIVGYVATIALFYVLTKSGNTKINVGEAYSGAMTYVFPAIWVTILLVVAFFGGFVLFIIPAIYIGVLLTFSIYVLFVENRRGLSSLVQSWYYVKGRRTLGAVFAKLLFFVIIVAVPFIAILILSVPFSHVSENLITHKPEMNLPISSMLLIQILSTFVVSPLSIIYSFFIFKALALKAPATPEEEKSIRKKIIFFMIIGAIFVAFMIVFFGASIVHSLQTTSTIGSIR